MKIFDFNKFLLLEIPGDSLISADLRGATLPTAPYKHKGKQP